MRGSTAVHGASLFAAVVVAGGAASAEPRNTVTWHPLSLLTGFVEVEYERVLVRYLSVRVAPAVLFGNDLGPNGGPYVHSGRVDVGARLFPWGVAPAGPYVDLYGGVTSSAQEALGYRYRGLGGEVGIVFGGTVVIAGVAVVSLGAGVQNTRFTAPGYGSEGGSYAFNVTVPVVRVGLGVAF